MPELDSPKPGLELLDHVEDLIEAQISLLRKTKKIQTLLLLSLEYIAPDPDYLDGDVLLKLLGAANSVDRILNFVQKSTAETNFMEFSAEFSRKIEEITMKVREASVFVDNIQNTLGLIANENLGFEQSDEE